MTNIGVYQCLLEYGESRFGKFDEDDERCQECIGSMDCLQRKRQILSAIEKKKQAMTSVIPVTPYEF